MQGLHKERVSKPAKKLVYSHGNHTESFSQKSFQEGNVDLSLKSRLKYL